MAEVLALVECNGRNVPVRLILLYKLQLKVAIVTSHYPSVSVVIHILSYKHRRAVARSKWLELFQNPEELRGNLFEIKERIYVYNRCKYLLCNFLGNKILKSL